MKFHRSAATGAVGALTLAGSLAAVSSAQAAPTVPQSLRVPDGNVRIASLTGRGVQTYDCINQAWTFRAPTAVLGRLDRNSMVHFGGPTFQSLRDGSSVTGRSIANVPAIEPGTVPQLLIQATGTIGGTGSVLGGTTFVQRLRTQGGAAPAGVCDASGQPSVAVPYRALYVFWKAR